MNEIPLDRYGMPFPRRSRHSSPRYNAIKRTNNQLVHFGHAFLRTSRLNGLPGLPRLCLRCGGKATLFHLDSGWHTFHEPPLLLLAKCRDEA
jgi:ribosomal protein L27